MTELAKAYDPKAAEERWYGFWRDQGLFRGPTGTAGEPVSVVIPPPNVTGVLHMGHALNNTLQDIIVRRARMQGHPTLWVPGTDHAGIATQNVVEQRLIEEGQTRHDLGREAFIERVWSWKQEYEARILGQLARLGASCDWERNRFTLDEGLSRAVRTVFVRLFEEGRIYRGNRIINWCPRCTTALSDIEVRHAETEGELITIRYPLASGDGHIAVSTTRVETMLGDTCIAVHPDDDRYRRLIGQHATLPLVGRELPIVADRAVDPEFGTGAVKVTPAHDPLDFEIAERQGMPIVNILDSEARVNADGGRFAGLGRYEARGVVLDALRQGGLVEREERPYVHAVGRCERCDTEVEPWLSEQWFVAMRDLAAAGIDAVRSGRVRIIPERPFEKMYRDWMENIRDWCISRQIWWGHRIPVWYCAQGHTFAALEDPTACAHCGSEEIEQDPDVLDTWFSSQLWPFSTLGWPEHTEDLGYWYPTSVLVTAYEILYLWVARMIMSGLHFMGEVPFREVLIHGIVRDFEGKKMSKSKGNVVDPLDVMDRYGTDAMRFALARAAVPGQDTNVAEEWIEGDRRFCNKLWNAARFVLQSLPEGSVPALPDEPGLPERWILSRLAQTQRVVDQALSDYQFGEASRTLHQFIWSEFCDWYVEIAKLRMGDTEEGRGVYGVLYYVLETALRLAHPMIPFITEEIWQRLPRPADSGVSIMVAPWPGSAGARIDAEAEEQMGFLQEMVVEIRRFRHEHQVPQKKRMQAVVVAPEPVEELLRGRTAELEALAWLSEMSFGDASPGRGWSQVVVGHAEVYLPLAEVVDVDAERARLQKEVAETEALLGRAHGKLANPGFVQGAPEQVVEATRAQASELEGKLEKLRAQLDELG